MDLVLNLGDKVIELTFLERNGRLAQDRQSRTVGPETFVDIALFGCKKRELLRRFRPFKDGTPTRDDLDRKRLVVDSFRCSSRR